MSQHIPPTVGRIVYYFEHGPITRNSQKGAFIRGPLAAVVTCVHIDGSLNLAVFNESGTTYPVTGVQLVQPGQIPPQYNHAQWMPYQVQQAGAQKVLKSAISAETSAIAMSANSGYGPPITGQAKRDYGMPDVDAPQKGTGSPDANVSGMVREAKRRIAAAEADYDALVQQAGIERERRFGTSNTAEASLRHGIPIDPAND